MFTPAQSTISNHTTPQIQFGKLTKSILRARKRIGESARIVYEGLLTFRNDRTGEAYCSVGTLAELVTMDHRRVQRELRKLELLGLISWTTRTTAWGSRIYSVLLEMPADRTGGGVVCDAGGGVVCGTALFREDYQKEKTTPYPLLPARAIRNGNVVVSLDLVETTHPHPEPAPKMETTQPQPGPTPQMQPIHPTLSSEDQATINRMITKLTGEQSGQVVAELSARLSGQGETIRNPPAFAAKLVQAVRNGTFTPSATRIIKELQTAREQRIAQLKATQETEKQAEEVEAKAIAKLEEVKSRLTAEEMENHRAAFIQQLRKQSDFIYSLHKKSGFESFGFGLLFDSYLRDRLLVDQP